MIQSAVSSASGCEPHGYVDSGRAAGRLGRGWPDRWLGGRRRRGRPQSPARWRAETVGEPPGAVFAVGCPIGDCRRWRRRMRVVRAWSVLLRVRSGRRRSASMCASSCQLGRRRGSCRLGRARMWCLLVVGRRCGGFVGTGKRRGERAVNPKGSAPRNEGLDGRLGWTTALPLHPPGGRQRPTAGRRARRSLSGLRRADCRRVRPWLRVR